MQEAVVIPPFVALAVRPHPGIWEFVRANSDDLSVNDITMSEYLKYKESLYDSKWYMSAPPHEYHPTPIVLAAAFLVPIGLDVCRRFTGRWTTTR